MSEKPGRVGRSYPVAQHSANNSAPTAQASVTNDRVGIIALILGIIAVLLALSIWLSMRSLATDMENIRGLIENSAQAASRSAVEAALASERADKAERSAALSREYAVQVYPQLNRLGYPILSPGEVGHPAAQPEDYERLDRFAEGKP